MIIRRTRSVIVVSLHDSMVEFFCANRVELISEFGAPNLSCVFSLTNDFHQFEPVDGGIIL